MLLGPLQCTKDRREAQRKRKIQKTEAGSKEVREKRRRAGVQRGKEMKEV